MKFVEVLSKILDLINEELSINNRLSKIDLSDILTLSNILINTILPKDVSNEIERILFQLFNNFYTYRLLKALAIQNATSTAGFDSQLLTIIRNMINTLSELLCGKIPITRNRKIPVYISRYEETKLLDIRFKGYIVLLDPVTAIIIHSLGMGVIVK